MDDDNFKYFIEFCPEKEGTQPNPCNIYNTTPTSEECVPIKRKLNVRLNPEFMCHQKAARSDPGFLPLSSAQDMTGSPKLRVKKFSRPPTATEDFCEELELPFPMDEYEFLCNEVPDNKWGSTFCVQRILLLLRLTPEIAAIERRICDLWTFFERKSPHGVFVKDVRLLIGLVFSLGERKHEEDFQEFRKSLLQNVLAQLKRGIRFQRLRDKEDLSSFSSALGDLGEVIRRNDPFLINGSLDILEAWLRNYCDQANDDKGKVSSKSICEDFEDQMLDRCTFTNCLERSHLGKRLLQRISEGVFKKNESDFALFIRLTALGAELIQFSHKIRVMAIKSGMLEAILLQLKNPDTGNHLMVHTIHVIYGILAAPMDEELASKIPILKPEAFRVLLFRFLQRMKYIRSKTEINIRNDVGFAVYLLVKYFPNLRKCFGRHAFVLAGIVANNVIKQKDIPFILDSTSEDLELLKFLIWILQLILESDPTAEEIATRYQLVSVLLRILIGPCHILELVSDGDPCLEPLVKVAALTLTTMAKQFPSIFQQADGIDTMLNILHIYSEYGTLDANIIAVFFDISRILLTHETGGTVKYFVEKKAMQVFTDVLKEFSKRKWTMSDEPIMCNILMCISALGQYDESQRETFAEGQGIKILIRLMNLLVYSYMDQRHMNSTLHVCVAEIIWQCLAESPSALEMFLAYEGIFRLLDLLEIAAGPAAQIHILGCLVELCEYSRCVDQLLYWRRRQKTLSKRFVQGDTFSLSESRGEGGSKGLILGDGVGETVSELDISLSALLCELWRQEENRFKVLRETNGIIASLEKPLMSEFSRNFEKKIPNSSECNGPSCLDLTSSIRPKIYLLVKKIIETSNTEATVFGGLSLPNQITMQIIVNFLDLKRGEIWFEMADELKREGIKLVDSDEIALERFLKISKNKVSAVIDTQKYLVNIVREHDEMNEKSLYNTIQMCYLQDYLEALREAEFFARTSNYFLLVNKRLWQKAQLQQMVRNVGFPNARIHRTTDNSLNITNWPGRIKMIESEPKFLLGSFDEAKAREEAKQYEYIMANEEKDLSDEEDNGSEGDVKSGTRNPLVPSSFYPNTAFGSAEEGFSQVAPQALRKALLALLAEEKKWKWRDTEGENAWRMRSKWRSNWYPGEHLGLSVRRHSMIPQNNSHVIM